MDSLPSAGLETQLPEDVYRALLKPFTGDFDEMIKRRLIRIGVTFNRTFYFVDKGVQRGVAYKYGRLVEERINKALKTSGKNKVLVFFVPLSRDKLLPALVEGKLDMVAAQITVRPDLQKLVDFTNPTRMNVDQIIVTGPGAPVRRVGGRPVRPACVRSPIERVLPESAGAEREIRSAG